MKLLFNGYGEMKRNLLEEIKMAISKIGHKKTV
jgi:hypothetical protein